MWSFHDSVLSMFKPRNLMLLILVFIDLGAIIWIFLSFCFSVKYYMKWVLLQFNVKRLLWNQLVISVIAELILFLNSSGLVFDIIMVVSSANSIGLANLFMLKERSFIRIRNSNGPNIEPCGTPYFTCIHLEDSLLHLLLFTDTLWYLFSK